jgi:hypothetical protein
MISTPPSASKDERLGGGGTNRDTFELIHQAEKYGARVALFGRKIDLAESQPDIVHHMRLVADGGLTPLEAVRSCHAPLKEKGSAAAHPLADDSRVTEAVLKEAASAQAGPPRMWQAWRGPPLSSSAVGRSAPRPA